MVSLPSLLAKFGEIGSGRVIIGSLAVLLSGLALSVPLYALINSFSNEPTQLPAVPVTPDSGLVPVGGNSLGAKTQDDEFLVLVDVSAARLNEANATLHISVQAPVNDISNTPAGQLPLSGRQYTLLVRGCGQSPCSSNGLVDMPYTSFVEETPAMVTFQTDVTLPLAGDPRQFPSDRYSLGTRLDVLRNDISVGQEQPMQLFVLDGGGPPDLEAGLIRPQVDPYELDLDLNRSQTIAAYVYVVALVPCVFAALIYQWIGSTARIRRLEMSGLYGALAAVGLTLLPLRAVLIPPEIQTVSLTRVDLILAAQLGLLAGIATKAHWEWALRPPPIRSGLHDEP
jgi:hypothetical protein